ncbi:MAG: hypothetical protein Q9201_007075 [Fulgogasparrea decipioides]
MDPTPPAWLRNYKAQSAIIPNFASQVRPETDDRAPTTTPRQETGYSDDNNRKSRNMDPEPASADPFTFPSSISLTLHNGTSLDNSYSNSTPNSSPQKASFSQDVKEKSTQQRSIPALTAQSQQQQRRRGSLYRFLAGIRKSLTAKTQNKLLL